LPTCAGRAAFIPAIIPVATASVYSPTPEIWPTKRTRAFAGSRAKVSANEYYWAEDKQMAGQLVFVSPE
jgi:hypothetical protein